MDVVPPNSIPNTLNPLITQIVVSDGGGAMVAGVGDDVVARGG